MFLRKLFLIIFITILIGSHRILASTKDWKTVERLMEEYPYIAGLLNYGLEYVCTGTIISNRAVLTSGRCLNLNPKHVAATVAILGKKTSKSSVFDVDYTRRHIDYEFEIKAVGMNVTRMHSNMGLVFVVRPILDLFIPAAEIGNYYAPELKAKELTTVGFGELSGTRVAVLQYTNYNQKPCSNPRWYYCICGVEESNVSDAYEKDFGNGGPVLYGDEVVGVTASASGTLSLKATGEKYNIFTIVGPYLAWIEKSEVNMTGSMRAQSEANHTEHNRNQNTLIVKFLYLLLLIYNTCI